MKEKKIGEIPLINRQECRNEFRAKTGIEAIKLVQKWTIFSSVKVQLTDRYVRDGNRLLILMVFVKYRFQQLPKQRYENTIMKIPLYVR